MDTRSIFFGAALGAIAIVAGDKLAAMYKKSGDNSQALIQPQNGLIASVTCQQVLLSPDPETKGISFSAKTAPIPNEGGTVTEVDGRWVPGDGYVAHLRVTDNGRTEQDEDLSQNWDPEGKIERVVKPLIKRCSQALWAVPGTSG